jgi:hypothetical protein
MAGFEVITYGRFWVIAEVPDNSLPPLLERSLHVFTRS